MRALLKRLMGDDDEVEQICDVAEEEWAPVPTGASGTDWGSLVSDGEDEQTSPRQRRKIRTLRSFMALRAQQQAAAPKDAEDLAALAKRSLEGINSAPTGAATAAPPTAPPSALAPPVPPDAHDPPTTSITRHAAPTGPVARRAAPTGPMAPALPTPPAPTPPRAPAMSSNPSMVARTPSAPAATPPTGATPADVWRLLSPEERAIVEAQQRQEPPPPEPQAPAPTSPSSASQDKQWTEMLKAYGEHLTDEELVVLRAQLR